MLSGNGRHRRPRQAPALIVAAGVTGSAIAIPLLAASAANAADGTTWDKVANCESGGSWSANSGNGYYGGLQVSQDDWAKYGGLEYAPSADLASRSQQIAVAEKILDAKGTSAWTTCSLLSGLTTSSGSTSVDTGVASDSPSATATGSSDAGDSSDSSDSSDAAGSAGLSDSSGPADSGTSDAGSATPSPSVTDKSTGTAHAGTSGGTDKSSGSGTSGARSSHGEPTASPSVSYPGNSVQPAAKSSLVDTGSLGTVTKNAATKSATTKSATTDGVASGGSAAHTDAVTGGGRHRGASEETYTVRAGDTLGSIADSLGLTGGWRALYAANEEAIGADPARIVAGQTLDVSAETVAK
ncbi:transglycosylase family protein [Streptomyces sp. NPDC005423]|uniref:transglycosylase family protein n=1 Tax=Streptomyces sp. NPDC005423 TaxID=3155343 RepID=UPI0033B1534F